MGDGVGTWVPCVGGCLKGWVKFRYKVLRSYLPVLELRSRHSSRLTSLMRQGQDEPWL
jgi:hypothetical protein